MRERERETDKHSDKRERERERETERERERKRERERERQTDRQTEKERQRNTIPTPKTSNHKTHSNFPDAENPKQTRSHRAAWHKALRQWP